MKILLDIVYTGRPSTCSTSYLAWELIDNLVKWRDDAYFYLTFPSQYQQDEEQMAWLRRRHTDRIVLLPIPSDPIDRLSELYMLKSELRKYLVQWRSFSWDIDVVVSSRIPMLPHMFPHFYRCLSKLAPHLRGVFGLEEMPALPFRKTVPWSQEMYPLTLMSYAMTTGTLINNQWTAKGLREVCREVLSPSWVRKVLDKVHEVVPVKLSRLNRKTDEQMHQKGQSLKVTFSGRVTSTRNFEDVLRLFQKQFAYAVGGKKVECLVSTNSQMLPGGHEDVDFIDVQHNNREQFHAFLKEAHVSVNLTHVEDFSLSTYETLLAGVPVIVLDEDWNSFLGPDYPFRIKNVAEAYALVNLFHENYVAQYAKFEAWEQNWWASYVGGPKNITTSEKLIELLEKLEKDRFSYLEEREFGGSYKEEIVQLIAKDPKRLDLTACIREKGSFFDDKPDYSSLTVNRTGNHLVMKILASRMGFKDTLETGVMVKP